MTPDSHDPPAVLLHGHDGRLIEHDPLTLDVNQGVGGPQVHGDVVHRNEAAGVQPAEKVGHVAFGVERETGAWTELGRYGSGRNLYRNSPWGNDERGFSTASHVKCFPYV